ncbi:MAG TPA: CBS domain-containing protein [Polyangiaceae bacterium]|nr:CBS domain-containing protein [Polyangiaceae bacterium]
MIARELMSLDPYVAAATASLRQVMQILGEADVRHVPIVEEERLVGIISDRDLRAVMPPALARFDRPEQVERVLSQPVSQLMSSDVLTVGPDDEMQEVVDLMIEHKIGAVPVVEPGSAKLLGIVSYVDVLRAARELL